MKKTIWAVCCMLLVAPQAQAEIYRVDLLVFLDKSASGEGGRPFEPATPGKLLSLDNADALKDAGITLLPEDQFALANAWKRLKSSKRYQPLIRLAWTQDNPPADARHALRLSWGDTLVIDGTGGTASGLARPVEGNVALLLGSYLNLDVNLTYTRITELGAQSWRLREKRRLKRDELQHLDSPKLGVLAKVSRAG